MAIYDNISGDTLATALNQTLETAKRADFCIGYFPDRIPVRARYPFKKGDSEDQYARLYLSEVVNTINGLRLPRYGLGHKDYENKETIKTSPLKKQK
jgi:hypothetical protein